MKKARAVIFVLALFLFSACKKETGSLEEVLRLAGNNRTELEQVLQHYGQNPADSLKYKAACFLIENMPVHYYYWNNPKVFDIMDSLHQSDLSMFEMNKRFDSLKNTRPISAPEIFPDLQTLSAEFLIRHIDKTFENREQAPWKDKIAFRDFCEFVLPYAVSSEKRELWSDYYRDKYLPLISEKIPQYDMGSMNLASICLVLNEKLRNDYKMTVGFEKIHNYSPIQADHIRYGSCANYVARTIYLMRSLGMPVGEDFAPQWGNYASSHSWNTLLTEDGCIVPFVGFRSDVFTWSIDYRCNCSKVYRETFSIQKESLAAQNLGEALPGFLNRRNIRDVTSEYLPVCDVTLSLKNPDHIRSKTAYLCVFNNKTWIPVCGAPVKRNRVTFRNTGMGIVFLPAYYVNGNFVPAGEPFLLDTLKRINPLIPQERKETLVLERKWHLRKAIDYQKRMLNGKFSGANKPDFSDEQVIHEIRELPRLVFNTVDVNPGNKYRYVRYMADGTIYSDIAELEFYAEENGQYQKLSGKIIGTEGYEYDRPTVISKSTKEAAFDGKGLSFFAVRRINAWVGLDFGKPQQVDRIRFLPRNDDNNIRPGDLYELVYWHNGKWNSLGQKTGDESHVLVYDNCPSGALFLLHDHTQGEEERIFTYENGKQVWW